MPPGKVIIDLTEDSAPHGSLLQNFTMDGERAAIGPLTMPPGKVIIDLTEDSPTHGSLLQNFTMDDKRAALEQKLKDAAKYRKAVWDAICQMMMKGKTHKGYEKTPKFLARVYQAKKLKEMLAGEDYDTFVAKVEGELRKLDEPQQDMEPEDIKPDDTAQHQNDVEKPRKVLWAYMTFEQMLKYVTKSVPS